MRPRPLAPLVLLIPALALAERQDPATVTDTARAFLQAQTRGQPGRVDISLADMDARLKLERCPRPEAFWPGGARPWGHTTVGVRCSQGQGKNWTVYLQATVRIETMYYVTSRPLAPGHVLEAVDLSPQQGDVSQFAAGVIIDPDQAIGRVMAMGAGAGIPVRTDMLRPVPVVQQGQSVTLVARGAGFKVSGEGHALTTAGEGQSTQVRTPAGQVVSGVARAGGVVEVGL
jgi:flagellar basal body P-ring formation protein FlgA